MKLVLIGARNYAFTTTFLRDTLEKYRFADELVLMDSNKDIAGLMTVVGRKIASDLDLKTKINTTSDRKTALTNADFVFLASYPEIKKRWRMDAELLNRYNMGYQSRECGGLGGLSNALRGIHYTMELVHEMEKICPNAVLLTVLNPLTRIVTAVNSYSTIKCYGFSNVAKKGNYGYQWIADITECQLKNIYAVTAGLNRLAWLVSAADIINGINLYPIVRNTVKKFSTREACIIQTWLREHGGIMVGDIDLQAELLPFQPEIKYVTSPPYMGNNTDFEHQWQVLRDIAVGEIDWRTNYPIDSWERSITFAMAIADKKSANIDILNLPNDGHIRDYPNGPVVEVPVQIVDGMLVKHPEIKLPGKTIDLCIQISQIHDLITKGAVNCDLSTLHEGIDIDIAINKKEIAHDALEKILLLHADILPKYK
jgi:alpha-galactosidase/6-phospho-beta-glucosidase family protein